MVYVVATFLITTFFQLYASQMTQVQKSLSSRSGTLEPSSLRIASPHQSGFNQTISTICSYMTVYASGRLQINSQPANICVTIHKKWDGLTAAQTTIFINAGIEKSYEKLICPADVTCIQTIVDKDHHVTHVVVGDEDGMMRIYKYYATRTYEYDTVRCGGNFVLSNSFRVGNDTVQQIVFKELLTHQGERKEALLIAVGFDVKLYDLKGDDISQDATIRYPRGQAVPLVIDDQRILMACIDQVNKKVQIRDAMLGKEVISFVIDSPKCLHMQVAFTQDGKYVAIYHAKKSFHIIQLKEIATGKETDGFMLAMKEKGEIGTLGMSGNVPLLQRGNEIIKFESFVLAPSVKSSIS